MLVSDLLCPGDPQPLVNVLAADAAALVIVQLLAAADARPPQRGNVRLVDSETGGTRDAYVDAAVQQRYLAALARHQDHWRAAARRAGATFVTFIAEDLLANWDLRELLAAQVLRA